MLNWDMSDLTYLRMWNSGGSGGKPLLRWDGLPIKSTLKPAHLNETMLSFIEANTAYDGMLYEFFGRVLAARLAGLRAAGVDVDAEVAALRAMEAALEAICDGRGNIAEEATGGARARTAEERDICEFFTMDDLTYEATIDSSGAPRGVPAFPEPDDGVR